MSFVGRTPGLFTFLVASIALSATSSAAWESAASKNKEGNRLFQKGQYQDAEKAYLDAQLEDPGRAELLYNLGNTMEKQKKYDKAAQLLRQSAGKGVRGLQANSWYNLGNSLYETGNFQDSAQAYIQALRLNPSDRDAKHNLELAWRRLQEQKKDSSSNDQNDNKNKADSKKDQQQAQNDANKNKDQSQPEGARDQKDRKQRDQPQPEPAERKEGEMTKERATQILDAMKDQELMDLRTLKEKQSVHSARGKDW